jgi:hypothetical protein
MPTAGLRAQCKCPADAETFEKALIDAGFIARDGDTVTVIGWAEKNASLIAAWRNGGTGGRPKKNPAKTHGLATGNPALTQLDPMDNQEETHGEPMANPRVTDKIREDKIREDGIREEPTSSLRSDVPPRASRSSDDMPDGFSEFWTVWPRSSRKGGKTECLKVWKSRKLEPLKTEIVAHVKAMTGSHDWTKNGGEYIPAPVVYLRAAKWDGAEVQQRASIQTIGGSNSTSRADATRRALGLFQSGDVIDV